MPSEREKAPWCLFFCAHALKMPIGLCAGVKLSKGTKGGHEKSMNIPKVSVPSCFVARGLQTYGGRAPVVAAVACSQAGGKPTGRTHFWGYCAHFSTTFLCPLWGFKGCISMRACLFFLQNGRRCDFDKGGGGSWRVLCTARPERVSILGAPHRQRRRPSRQKQRQKSGKRGETTRATCKKRRKECIERRRRLAIAAHAAAQVWRTHRAWWSQCPDRPVPRSIRCCGCRRATRPARPDGGGRRAGTAGSGRSGRPAWCAGSAR